MINKVLEDIKSLEEKIIKNDEYNDDMNIFINDMESMFNGSEIRNIGNSYIEQLVKSIEEVLRGLSIKDEMVILDELNFSIKKILLNIKGD